MSQINDIIDMVVTAEEVKAGRSVAHTRIKTSFPLSAFSAQKISSNYRASRWTPAEDDYLRKKLGWLSEHEIAKNLGRTAVAVRIRWKRDLHLTPPSKHPEFITGEQASIILGVDNHAFSHWCDSGLIPYRNMTAGRKMRLIYRTTFLRWVISTSNWIYFDWHKITDPRLRRLCELRAQRWGDEWWTSRQVADYHNANTKDVQRLIYRGELPARQVETSRGGRHKDPAWLNWYVLKSDALPVTFRRGKGSARAMGYLPTPRAQAWMLKAWAMGWNFSQICRSMGNPVTSWSLRQYMVRTFNIKVK